MAQKVTFRKVETGTIDTYELRTTELGTIAMVTKDYEDGPVRKWSWTLVDGIAFSRAKSKGSAYNFADTVATVQARLNAYGLKEV